MEGDHKMKRAMMEPRLAPSIACNAMAVARPPSGYDSQLSVPMMATAGLDESHLSVVNAAIETGQAAVFNSGVVKRVMVSMSAQAREVKEITTWCGWLTRRWWLTRRCPCRGR